MRRLSRTACVAAGALALIAAAPHSVDKAQALKIEDGYFAAMKAGDVKALDAMTAPDFVYNHGDGHTDTKGEMLQRMGSGIAKFKGIRRLDDADAPHNRGTTVLATGDGFIATGRIEFLVSMYGAPAATSLTRLTTAWRRTPKGWRAVMWQSTPITIKPK